MKTYITSDTHFGHLNIIKYCNRPFKDVEEMEWKLIENWNSVVGTSDEIYHLGDFAMGGNLDERVPKILARLNGIKHLIRGNHDKRATANPVLWATVTEGARMILSRNREVMLRHYNPQFEKPEWEGKDRGVVLLHGHSHGNHHGYEPGIGYLDVGVDCWNYFPISMDKAVETAQKNPKDR